MSDVLTIAAGAVEGFGTIYAGLEQSASILGKNLSENSVKIIEHKYVLCYATKSMQNSHLFSSLQSILNRYGSSAGSLASETFDTVGNVINLTQNVNSITPKGIAKRTAKNAGRAIVEDYRPRLQSNNVVPAGALYPDLSGLQAKIQQ